MVDAASARHVAAIASRQEQDRPRWEVRPARLDELERFFALIEVPLQTFVTEPHVALIGNEIVAVGLLRLDHGSDRLYGHLNVAGEIPTGLGLMMLRTMRRVLKRTSEPVYTYPATHLYGERPNRLLAYLGFDLSSASGEEKNVDA